MDIELRARFAKNLSKALSEARKTQADMAKYLGVSSATSSDWVNGKKMPRSDKIQAICNWLKIELPDLLIEYNPKQSMRKGVRIPVYGYIRAGIPVEAISEILDYEEIPQDMAKNGEYFALQVRGDSMLPELREGDVVIVKAQNDIETGEMAIVAVNGDDATVKRVIKSNSGITLIPSNTTYPPIIYSGADITNLPVEIKGKVVELRRKF